jgi:hypothetical protein
MGTIRERAQKCFDLFEQWLVVASSGDDFPTASKSQKLGETDVVDSEIRQTERTGSTAAEPNATTDRKVLFDNVKFENCHFRFNLWADYYSVTSSGHDSLDWRLRESSTTYSVVLDLVEDLSRAISGK